MFISAENRLEEDDGAEDEIDAEEAGSADELCFDF